MKNERLKQLLINLVIAVATALATYFGAVPDAPVVVEKPAPAPVVDAQ